MPRLGGFSRAVTGQCISCLEDNYKAGKRVSGGSQRLHLFFFNIALSFNGVSSSFGYLVTKCLFPSMLRHPAKEGKMLQSLWGHSFEVIHAQIRQCAHVKGIRTLFYFLHRSVSVVIVRREL